MRMIHITAPILDMRYKPTEQYTVRITCTIVRDSIATAADCMPVWTYHTQLHWHLRH